MTNPNSPARRVAYYGMLLGVALILSWLERMIPFDFGIPGIKPGFTNIVVVTLLYRDGAKPAILVNFLRLVLSSILFGTGVSFLYGLSGGVLSWLAMLLLKRAGFIGTVAVSAVGGVCHNIGQLIMAGLVLSSSAVISYLPYLLISGILAGTVVGFASSALAAALKKAKI